MERVVTLVSILKNHYPYSKRKVEMLMFMHWSILTLKQGAHTCGKTQTQHIFLPPFPRIQPQLGGCYLK